MKLCRLPVVTTDADLVRRAITTSRRRQPAVWDALIVEAARSSGCDRILTEDLQNGQDFDGITAASPLSWPEVLMSFRREDGEASMAVLSVKT